MKKNLLTAVLCAFAFGLGLGVNNFALSDASVKVASVDVAKLLSSSKAIKAAQDTRERQTKELLKWYDSASIEINQKQDAAAKQVLINKYEAQLTQKKTAIKDEFAKKMNAIDKQMESVIAQKARELGYDYVFRSDVLLYGGNDITSHVSPLVK